MIGSKTISFSDLEMPKSVGYNNLYSFVLRLKALLDEPISA
jgi:hypothetical protein